MKKIFDLLKTNGEFVVCAVLALVFVGLICFGTGRSIKIDETSAVVLNKIGEELESITAEISSQKDVLAELENYKTQREAKQNELNELNTKLTSLTDEVKAKQIELEKLTGTITAIKSEKVLTAGKYIVGEDIEAGKYDVRLVSGHGNFFVNGSNYVNEIFGTRSDYYISEYKNLYLENGDEIELRSNLKLKLLLKE